VKRELHYYHKTITKGKGFDLLRRMGWDGKNGLVSGRNVAGDVLREGSREAWKEL